MASDDSAYKLFFFRTPLGQEMAVADQVATALEGHRSDYQQYLALGDSDLLLITRGNAAPRALLCHGSLKNIVRATEWTCDLVRGNPPGIGNQLPLFSATIVRLVVLGQTGIPKAFSDWCAETLAGEHSTSLFATIGGP